MIDIHAHILPGVDDGARDIDESVEIVRWLHHQGVERVIATPHYIVDTEYSSPKEINTLLLEELKSKLKGEGVEVELALGNEIYIDREVISLLRSDTISSMAGGSYLLVELPINDVFLNYEDYLQALISMGYKVILAHPERYVIMQKDYKKLCELCEMGVLLQCNLRSILGSYGKKPEHLIKKLAKEKRIFALASDTHRVGKVDYLKIARQRLKKYYNERELEQLLTLNPGKVLTNTLR